VEGTIINPEDFTDQPVADIVAEEALKTDVSDLTVNEEGELIIKAEEETGKAGDTEKSPE